MSSFTEILTFESTAKFVGGKDYTKIVKGESYTIVRGGRRVFRTTKAFKYVDESTGYSFVVPEGTDTDLGSIPWLAQIFVTPDSPWSQAYVLHDFLYDQIRRKKIKDFSRIDADKALYDALKLPFQISRNDKLQRAICPSSTRNLIFWAVRLFGRL